jgi:hypothetical protein
MALSWQDDSRTGKTSKAPPALAKIRNLIHMIHIGGSSNDLWHSWFDGKTWSKDVRIPGQKSKAAPALAGFCDHLLRNLRLAGFCRCSQRVRENRFTS